jgi:hypothetical protein
VWHKHSLLCDAILTCDLEKNLYSIWCGWGRMKLQKHYIYNHHHQSQSQLGWMSKELLPIKWVWVHMCIYHCCWVEGDDDDDEVKFHYSTIYGYWRNWIELNWSRRCASKIDHHIDPIDPIDHLSQLCCTFFLINTHNNNNNNRIFFWLYMHFGTRRSCENRCEVIGIHDLSAQLDGAHNSYTS